MADLSSRIGPLPEPMVVTDPDVLGAYRRDRAADPRASAVDGALMISTEKMRGVVVDPATRTAVCRPGMLNAARPDAAPYCSRTSESRCPRSRILSRASPGSPKSTTSSSR